MRDFSYKYVYLLLVILFYIIHFSTCFLYYRIITNISTFIANRIVIRPFHNLIVYHPFLDFGWVVIGSANGLSPARPQAITRTNADLPSAGP